MKHSRCKGLFFAGALVTTLSACGTPTSTQTLAGWYSEHGIERSFHPCKSDESWPIVEAGDLPSHARAFGLQPDTPVYVKLQAQVSASGAWPRAVHVRQVVQFGSPTPVRNCPMTGVVTRGTPAAAASR